MSFGFSLGDFLAVANFATQLYTCLSEVRGSEAAYKEAVSLLQSLSTSLRTVHSTLSSSASVSGLPPPDIAVVSGLGYHLRACRELMNRFLYVLCSLGRLCQAYPSGSAMVNKRQGGFKKIHRKLHP
jgi:hypothetical protein